MVYRLGQRPGREEPGHRELAHLGPMGWLSLCPGLVKRSGAMFLLRREMGKKIVNISSLELAVCHSLLFFFAGARARRRPGHR